ncbi:nicotinate-nucleotide--dimethylbenzimidazole phosphoribosyltransferase [Christensenella intestinihominis]|uniref:nicotinate-nucleotide--dimethylbenzimidazole phosphoribosyltransferase n=1 Tax=Christensenella intestinihominis TaxID=1851429 RepID=UPI000835B29E|nr:nicotinate-nucleotide--dimethylbenzimidazole phosphoribosyltransferase [Christensenella intestinihominis]
MDYTDILPLDEDAMAAARERVDSLSKPLGSLGQLEEYAVRLAGIRGFMGGTLARRAVLVFAADNGVYGQGITPVPQAVTPMQTINIANGIAGVNALAAQAGAEVFVYNVGVAQELKRKNIIDALVMHGTNDMTYGPAMTRAQCERAMKTGYEAAAAREGYDVIGLGEMGICNTSTTAAVASVLLGKPVSALTGRGAGITDGQYEKKISVIEKAIEVNKPDASDPVDVIAKVGGLDIAAMTGAYLACAHYRVPVVIDGFISVCAALCAMRISPASVSYMFASHKSDEQGYTAIAEALGLAPALTLGMRLGEGSGCPLMFYILEASLRMLEDMGTFAEGSIDPSEFVDLRK